MCRDQEKPLLVMDVEGTDGRERGEDQVWIPQADSRPVAEVLAGLREKERTFQHGYS